MRERQRRRPSPDRRRERGSDRCFVYLCCGLADSDNPGVPGSNQPYLFWGEEGDDRQQGPGKARDLSQGEPQNLREERRQTIKEEMQS